MFNGVNKKTIIQLIIIIVAFGAAGLVLYNGFSNNGNSGVLPAGVSGQATSTQAILPYGDTLDFSKALDTNRFQYNQIDYPLLDPKNDVGIPQNSLIIPPPAIQPVK